MNIKSSIIECIGETPMVYLNNFAGGTYAKVAAKLEMFNPYSIKDRPVSYMISEAKSRGQITKDTTIIEASSGNTAIALATICTMKGYHLIICMSEIQSIERRKMISALGAELVLTPKEKGTRGAREKAKELAEEISDSYYICQHSNPDNIKAHIETTAEELWRDTEGKIDVLVCGLGTTGTAMGVAKVIKPRKPEFRIVGVEPEQAPILSQGIFNPHRIMGTAPGWVPNLYDPSLVDDIILVSESEAFEAVRTLAKSEGLLVGISSGATAHVGRELAKRKENKEKLIVCIFADSGERYLSVDGLY
ncbi:MAG: cysteine synthase family protein [Methanomassiliicoccales archaeon]|nr:MAG: cysteine synthase family protein [Methanomassiliicoccales archaeon]